MLELHLLSDKGACTISTGPVIEASSINSVLECQAGQGDEVPLPSFVNTIFLCFLCTQRVQAFNVTEPMQPKCLLTPERLRGLFSDGCKGSMIP